MSQGLHWGVPWAATPGALGNSAGGEVFVVSEMVWHPNMNGWYGTFLLKWMITRGSPIFFFGNLQVAIFVVDVPIFLIHWLPTSMWMEFPMLFFCESPYLLAACLGSPNLLGETWWIFCILRVISTGLGEFPQSAGGQISSQRLEASWGLTSSMDFFVSNKPTNQRPRGVPSMDDLNIFENIWNMGFQWMTNGSNLPMDHISIHFNRF